MSIPSQDGFEDYRRNRNRRRLREGNVHRPTAPGSMDVLKELERREAAELQDQQLSREVQEFFVDATQTAASIVQKVSKEQEASHGARMTQEMEEFLMSTLQRLERFVASIRKGADGREATAEIETQMQNIVGPMLDAFRNEGTARLEDKHIGQDPFATEIAEVARKAAEAGPQGDADAMPGAEFELEDSDASGLAGFAPVAGPAPASSGPGSTTPQEPPKAIRRLEDDRDDGDLQDHLIAQMHQEATANRQPDPKPTPAPKPPAGSGAGSRAADHPMLAGLVEDPEKLKKALKVLVQNQLMSKDEALAIWRAEMA